MLTYLAIHIEHMLYSRAMMTVKKKVARPELLFLLTLIWKTAGTPPGQQPGPAFSRPLLEVGSDPGRISWH